jgi:hypothetical protein
VYGLTIRTVEEDIRLLLMQLILMSGDIGQHICVSGGDCDAGFIRDTMQDSFHVLFLSLMSYEALPGVMNK